MTEDDLRRELGRALHRSKQIKDLSALAVIEIDGLRRIVGWNRQAERIFGWQAEEILGRSFEVIVPPQDRMYVDEVFHALVQGQVRHSRNPNLRKDGTVITCQWNNSILSDFGGAFDLIYAEVRDVSEEEELRRDQQLMQALNDHSPLGIYAKSPEGRYLYANREFARALGRSPLEVVGADDFTLFKWARAEELRRHDAAVLASSIPLTREDTRGERTFWTLSFALRDASGVATALCGLISDVTELRRGEHDRAALQQRVIDAQALALAELSTPLIPVAEGVLVMPLIGAIDAQRAARITEAMLTEVARSRARSVILDITGVRTIDSHVAGALVVSARSLRLLGAEAILTGIRPDVAQTLVTLGVDLRAITTLGNLQSGVAHAMRRFGSRPQ